MKKMTYRCTRSRIFYGFLISSVALIFLSLNLTAILFFKHISENAQDEEKRALENRLYTFAEDMNNQLENMSRIVLKIALDEKFSLNYINDNKYYQIEIAELMMDYRNISNISKEYFVMFESYDRVFSSSGTTISLERYFSEKHGMNGEGEILAMLDSLCEESKQSLVLYNEDGITLFLYPMQTYASKKSGKQGVVGFIISSSAIQERMERLIGKVSGDMSIYYKSFCIYGEENALQTAADDLFVSVQAKDFRILAQMDANSYFSWKNVFSYEEIITFLIIVVSLLLLTYIIVWWNYFPFQRIVEKYFYVAGKKQLLCWKDIDAMMEIFLNEKETSGKLAKEQLRILREQAIQLIVTSGYSDRLQNRLFFLNIKLDYPVFGVIRTKFQKNQRISEHDDALHQNIEDLSGKGFNLYSFWDNDGVLQILAAVEEEYQLDEIVELLQSLFDTMNLYTEVELYLKCRDLKKLHLLRREGNSGTTEEKVVPEVSQENKRNSGKQKNTAKQAIEYINAHCTDYNLSLDMIARDMQITPAYLCTILKQEIGMNYKEYLAQLRVEEAKKLLAEGYIGVTEVCYRVGYVNASYFIKIFQKYTGVTPTVYRAECHKEQ